MARHLQAAKGDYSQYPFLVLKGSKQKPLKIGGTYLVDNVKLLMNRHHMPVMTSTRQTVVV